MELAPGVEVVASLPAIYVRRIGAVVIADTHLGFEEEAARQGFFVPRIQLARTLEVLGRALDETGADRVIFAGDVKHCFSRLLRSEREEVHRVLSYLVKERGVEVTIVRGNHDNYLPIVAKDYGIELVNEYYEKGVLVIHGHRKPGTDYAGKVDVVIMGHEHPSLRLRDKLGYVAKLPAFLVAPYEKLRATLIVLPAVGQYQTGTTVSLNPDTYLSPILREDIDLAKIKPYILAEELGVLEFPELELLEDLLAEIEL